MAKDTQDQRHNGIVQNDITRRQAEEAARKRIEAEIAQRRQDMGPSPDPVPRDYLERSAGIRLYDYPHAGMLPPARQNEFLKMDSAKTNF